MGIKIIGVGNHKGGVAKSTLSITLAAGLAREGYKVMLVDADPQGSASEMVGVGARPGFYDLLVRDEAFGKVAVDLPGMQPDWWCMVVPGNAETRVIPRLIQHDLILRERLFDLVETVNVVVIDMSPTIDELHGMIYMAVDAMIIPTQLEYASFGGLANTLEHIEKANGVRMQRGMMKDIVVAGIVPTFFSNKVLHRVNLDSLRESYQDMVWHPIYERIAWAEAAQVKKDIFAYAPKSAAGIEAGVFIKQVRGYIDGKQS